MGFNPSKLTFVLAVLALWGLNKSMWERRVNAYKRWGLSEEEILVAFRKSPWCIIASEDKIMQVMDFFVNKMGFEASLIVKRPVLLTLSLEKRMIPRGSVIEVLLSKGTRLQLIQIPNCCQVHDACFTKLGKENHHKGFCYAISDIESSLAVEAIFSELGAFMLTALLTVLPLYSTWKVLWGLSYDVESAL
uniref:Uncharacterized protein n=1 Tax=Fagus sylvatica TaxID=28930 RepID=A0A2N9J152_FAGSY